MDFRDVLRECAAKLISTADSLVQTSSSGNTGEETQTTVTNSESSRVAQTTDTASGTTTGHLGITSPIPNLGTASSTSVLDEHRRIFGYRPPVGGCQRQRNARRAVSVPARPRQTLFSPKNTWTKVFVCLAKKHQTTVPSAAEKIALSCGELGEQKITFHKDGNSSHVHAKIMETFPALENGGGYDILRSSEGHTKNLMEIPAPPSGYSVAYLRSVLGQAKGYLRPIQKSITLEEFGGVAQNEVDLIKVNCLNCHLEIPMNHIKEHQANCKKESTSKVEKDIETTVPSIDLTFLPSASTSTSTSIGEEQHDSSNETSISSDIGIFTKQLLEMFPDKSEEEIVEVLKDTDMEIHAAIAHFLKDNEGSEDDDLWNLPLPAAKHRKLDGIESLKEFINKVLVKYEEDEYLSITRDRSIIDQVIHKYKNPMFNIKKELNVRFSSSGTPELGVDAGGPTAEYFYLLMKELVRGNFYGIKLFEGEHGHWLPKFDYDLASGGMFKLVGRMILHAVLHNCRGISGISPAAVSYIFSGRRDAVLEYLDVKDIPDPCLRNNLSKLLICNENELGNFTDLESPMYIGDILVAAGFQHIEVTMNNRALAYECCLTYDVITKRIPVLDDLRQGLLSEQSMGLSLLDIGNMHSEVKLLVFPGESKKIDLHLLKRLIQFPLTEDDQDAITAKTFFEQYIEELDQREGSDDETLNDLLQFWTCWPSLPMLGEKLSVSFLPKIESEKLAVVDTCWKSLKIPVIYSTYEKFKEKFDISVKFGKCGFGKF